jgi:BlaI family transcriptional regulator, penicillinase repressor
MEILWKKGPGTAEQIREALAPRRLLKDSSVRTVLGRLEEKGYVIHTIEGKAFVYNCIEKPRNIAVRAVRQILDRFCDGSLEQLLAGLVENEVVGRTELPHVCMSLKQLLLEAFDLPSGLLLAAPDWTDTDAFDISAKIPNGATQDQLPEMFQSLLEDRFGLAFHRVAKEGPVNALVIAKAGDGSLRSP